ncbi:Uncharacterised protein [Mycobacteroides abscessus subsp. massiliense]|nr:Uncharacterised protein [Mycobacteroides abscessus subsp. massiliense]
MEFNWLDNAIEGVLLFFGRRTNNRHLADRFKRIRTHRSFSGTHYRIGTVQYRIGHVAHFGTGRYGIRNHGFHHLGRGNAEAAQLTGAADHAFLQGRNGGMTDFHCQVAAGNHNTVAGEDDFV